tara:strand:- start:19 stop:126 length:108 start_codon:yes stop_codon:yes gene_type:complete
MPERFSEHRQGMDCGVFFSGEVERVVSKFGDDFER